MEKLTLPSLIGSGTVLCLTMATSAHGQAGGVLEEITVSAMRMETSLARVPAAISIVGKDDIQLGRQQLALDESLSRVPGIFMQNRYNFAQDLRVSIRGFGARANFGIRGVKILVDGIPETLPDGQGSVDGIDIGATSQIEILRGPSSTQYGNASGGVIAVTSESAPEEAFADVRLSGGSYGFRKLQVKAGGQTDKVGYLLSLSDSELDGYREQSRSENTQFTGRFDFDLGKEREFMAVVNFTDQPISDDAGGVSAEQAAMDPRSARDLNVLYNAGEYLEQSRMGFVYSMPVGESAEITARNYYVWRDFGGNLPFTDAGIIDLDRFFVGGGISYNREGTLMGRPNQFVFGFDFDDQDDDRKRYDNNTGTQGALTFDQNESVRSHGLFIQNQVNLSENTDLSFGVRFDEVEFDVTDRFLGDGDDSGIRKLDGTSPMLGITVGLTDDLVFYSTYSSAFETPTTTEFNDPDGGGGFNPTLDPQTARNLEVGLRGVVSQQHRYEVALFNIKVDDELIPFEVPGSPGRDFFANAGKSQRDGLEFSLISQPTMRISTTLSYTYSDFKFDEFTDGGNNYAGNRIPGTPENVLFGEINYQDPRGWYGAFDFLMVDDQFANNTNSVTNESYTVANLRFGFEKELNGMTVSPFIGINNLFDETYSGNVRINAFGGRFFEPAPERNTYAGVSLGFNFR